MQDQTKMLLFVALSLVVLVMVSAKPRPTEATPLDGSTPVGESQTSEDQDLSAVPTWAANMPNYGNAAPLALMMPETGGSPVQ